MRKIKFILSFIFMVLFLLLFIDSNAMGYSKYIGNDIYGLYPTTDKRIDVLSEELTINFSNVKDIFEEGLNYDGNLNAKYELYNPTDTDITTNLVFPIGITPDYCSFEDFSSLASNQIIKVNDSVIEKEIRYTYINNGIIDVNETYKSIFNKYKTYDGLNRDTKVYKYTIEFITDNTFDLVEFNILNDNCPVISDKYLIKEEDKYQIFLYDDKFDIYSFGEKIVINNLKLYLDEDRFDGQNTPVDFTFRETVNEMTLVNFTDSLYKNIKGINTYDKFNCFMDYFTDQGYEDVSTSYLGEYYLGAFYTYSLDIKAKEKVITEVNAPIFPNVDISKKPNVYEFRYLFDSCKIWNSFNNLTININSSYLVLNDDLNIEENENGYSIIVDDLSKASFSFDLCESTNPASTNPFAGLLIAGYGLVVVLVMILLAPLVIFIIVMVDMKHKKKNNKLKKYLWIELLLSTYAFIIALVSNALSYSGGFVSIASLVLIIGCLALFIIESIKFKKFTIVRTTLAAIFILGYISFLFDEANDIIINLYEASYLCIIFGFMLGICIIITMIKKRNYIPNENDENNYDNKKYYPIGYLSMKSFVIFMTLIVLFGIGAVILGVWLSSFLTVVVLIIYALIVFIISLIKVLLDNKHFSACNKDLDFDKLIINVEKMLSNPKIHPETKNFYLINLCSYVICYDFDKLEEIRREMFYPKHEMYKFAFEGLFVNYLLDEKEFVERINRLKAKFPKKQYINALNNFYERWMVYYTGKINKPMDLLLPIGTKNNVINGTNLYIRIHYFYKNNDFEMAKKLKDEFISKYYNMKEVVKMLNDLDL